MKIENQNKSGLGIQPQSSRKSTKRKWIILLLIVAVLAVSGMVARTITGKTSIDASEGGTFTARRDNLTITVTEGGSIRAHKSIEYKCKVERRGGGEVSILSIIPAGTYITQEDVDNGKVLVELDSSALKERLISEEMELASDQESVTSAKEAYEIQEIDNESAIAEGQLKLRFALLDLQKYLGADIANRLIEDLNDVSKTTKDDISKSNIVPNTNEGEFFGQTQNDVGRPSDMSNMDMKETLSFVPGESGRANGKSVENTNEALKLTELIAPFIEEVRRDPNLLAGSAAGEDWKSMQDNIVMAEGQLKTAEDTLTGTRKLHDANYVSDLDLQKDELTLVNRKFSRESSEVTLKLFLDYDFPKSAEQFLSDYIEAGRSLQRTYAQCRSRLAQAQVRLSTAQQRYNRQAEQVRELKEQIEFCIIRAKAPGLVVYGTGGTDDIFRAMRGRGGGMSSGIIAEGETVTEGQTIISMPDTATMVAEISVHETEVDKVRPGQPATIVMDAFPDRVFQGEVIEVAPLPDQQRGWMNPDLKVYETLVRIDGSHDFLRSRMSCKVAILVAQIKDAIIVPIQVVSNRGGQKVCFVKTSQGPQERVVRTGLFNDTFVEIVEGLEAGEEVLLNPSMVVDRFSSSDIYGQQQAIPQERPKSDTTDANDTGTQDQRGDQTRRVGGRSRDGDRQGVRGERSAEGGQSPWGGGPPGQFQLSDEMIDKIMKGMAQTNPEKAKELEKLRKSDPEKFKSELMADMRNMMRQMMRQGGGGMRPGQRQGQGDAEGGRNR
jgi:HlyD family secretion protein